MEYLHPEEWRSLGGPPSFDTVTRDVYPAGTRRTVGEVRAIARGMAAAGAALHAAGIVHRDIKCQNIMRDAQGRLVLMDLGAASRVSEDPDRALVGTPLYMSPELLAGKGGGYSFASDVYSLGCILYELTMLRAPFKEPGMSFNELCKRVVVGNYEAIPQITQFAFLPVLMVVQILNR